MGSSFFLTSAGGVHAFQSARAMTAPKISASHDAGGNPRSRRGSFSFIALHLTQDSAASPQAAQGFSAFDFMGPASAAEYRFGLLLRLGGSGRQFLPAVWAGSDVIRATAPTIRAIHGVKSIVAVFMIMSASARIFRMRRWCSKQR